MRSGLKVSGGPVELLSDGNFLMGPSMFDSRSNCEPTRLARESSSGAPVGVLADSPLNPRVQKPGGIGKLEPLMFAASGGAR
jgi:hypothetical protein